MAQVRVWNDNVHGFEQMYHDRKISIAAGAAIEMEEHEASDFMGTYSPMLMGGDGLQDPRSFKRLRVERLKRDPGITSKTEDETILCQACGFKARSKWELDGHVAEMHLEDMLDEKEVEKIKKVVKRGRPFTKNIDRSVEQDV